MLKIINPMLININNGPKTTSVETIPIGKNNPAKPMHAGHTPTKNANAEPTIPPDVFFILQTFGCLNL